MLRIEKLVLKNFGAYYGTSILSLSSDNGVSIVWGYNGHGKTTIMNAFRYVLWDEIYGRHRRSLKPVTFVNTDAIIENGNMLVELYFRHNDKQYTVSRGLNRKGGDGSKDEDYEKVFQIKQDSTILSNKAAADLLSEVLPGSISRFYLFDGELLEEYEDLMDDSDQSGQKIKDSIETILGMPILLNGRDIFESITIELNKAVAKASQNNDTTKAQSATLNKLNEKLDELKRSKDDLQKQLDEQREEKSKITERMSNSSQFSKIIGEKKTIEDQISTLNEDKAAYEEALSEEAENAWKTILGHLATDKILESNKKIASLNEKEQQVKIANAIITFIKNEMDVDKDHCPVCKTGLDDKLRLAIESKFIDGSDSSLSKEEKDLLQLVRNQVSFLQGIQHKDRSESIKSSFASYDGVLLKIAIAETKLAQKKKELNSINHDVEESEETILALPKQLEKCESLISTLKGGLEQNAIDITNTLNAIDKINKNLKKIAGGSDLDSALWNKEFASRLHDLFEEGISSFRTKLKDNVENDATSIFKIISHAPDYDRLSINDNFGLSILKTDGSKVPNRSSGYEQVVAISLISALHKNAPIEGPVFMDSTFQRIDPIHKMNTLKSLPVLGNQIIILAYDQEMGNINDVRSTLGDSLVQEFEIKQISSSHSELKTK